MRTAAQRRVSLVVTSNYAPDDLLPNPLWHDHFLPTIEAIKDMMDVVEINGSTDFRRYPATGTRPARETGAFRSGRIITPVRADNWAASDFSGRRQPGDVLCNRQPSR
ncbi:AFG1/ZapE family ATPase [Arthrobacter sp. TS-15]|uniref:AFG1/ZapE family ATPase n=1 Tax=Arthrobacter sp. TS-15 TaxID=2510797 RepID=UPI00237BCC91|nr:AFG1/ZapE family ATPase [Arthrobacter sp. TS-15]